MFKPDYSQEYALATWYAPDNALYRDTEHPTIKLAGEIGELLDCAAKNVYKPGYNWFNLDKNGLPTVVGEIGDCVYYLRILTWQYGLSFIDLYYNCEVFKFDTEIKYVKRMYTYAAKELDKHSNSNLIMIIRLIKSLMESAGCSLDYILQTNYRKLNSDETKHGWANAGVKNEKVS